MKIIYIISGVSKGLGYEMASEILTFSGGTTLVIGISRSIVDLSESFPNTFKLIQLDLQNFEFIVPYLDKSLSDYVPEVICFISNAGDIHPIASIGEYDNAELSKSLSVNVLSPAIIINYLVKKYGFRTRLLLVNISSGAANRPIKGWSLYASAKTFMKLYFDILEAEWDEMLNSRVKTIQIDPGAMDTDMQKVVRNAKIKSEQVNKLRELHSEGRLRQPKDVAKEIVTKIVSFL